MGATYIFASFLVPCAQLCVELNCYSIFTQCNILGPLLQSQEVSTQHNTFLSEKITM